MNERRIQDFGSISPIGKEEPTIKGPGLKLDLDVRRCWECPACGRRMKRLGEVVTYQCHCQEPPVWMHLVEPQRPAREYQPYIVPEIQADELMNAEDAPAAEAALPEDAEVFVEVALAPEPVEDIPAADVPLEEEFYSPEEDIAEPPQVFEAEIANLSEPAPAGPPLSAESDSSPPAQSSVDPNPRPNRSKRRRSGRKRNRRGKPGGGEGG